ncbi:MAG: hypothetical protein J5534_11560 [Fibrobacter sp.]|nr:hypothetical protein [Fibrobacter sp.]
MISRQWNWLGYLSKNIVVLKINFFSLHPLVKGCVLKKKGEFIIRLYDNGEYDLFREKKLNVIALCGKNGCGKSTLINLIFDKNDERFLFFKDSNNRIASSDKFCVEYRGNLCRLVDEISLDIVDSSKDDYSTDYKLKHDFWSDFLEHYIADPDLYSFVNDGRLFTHYEIHLDKKQILGKIWVHFYSEKLGKDTLSDTDVVKYPLYLLIANEITGHANEVLDVFCGEKFHLFSDYVDKVDKFYPRLRKMNQELCDLLFSNYSDKLCYKSTRISSYAEFQSKKAIYTIC